MRHHYMTTADVAEAFGVSVVRIRQLDSELQPVRRPNGHRRYDPRVVEQVLARRAVRGNP